MIPLEHELAQAADPTRAASLEWFFKTGKDGYGEGDRFLGITVPVQRSIALRFRDLPRKDLERLLESAFHEHRFCALEILVSQYERGSAQLRQEIFDFYLSHTAGINNWDLVDTSAPYIVGEHCRTRPRKVLQNLAQSKNIWERRIAIVATLTLIKAGETEETFRIAEMLLEDRHDLIRKAVGWALRETGKLSRPALLSFLQLHYASISRTTLRYAIEHFAPGDRKQMLAGMFDRIGCVP